MPIERRPGDGSIHSRVATVWYSRGALSSDIGYVGETRAQPGCFVTRDLDL